MYKLGAIEEDATRIGTQEAGDQVGGCTFSRAIGANQAGDAAGGDGKGAVIDGSQSTKALHKLAHIKNGLAGCA